MLNASQEGKQGTRAVVCTHSPLIDSELLLKGSEELLHVFASDPTAKQL